MSDIRKRLEDLHHRQAQAEAGRRGSTSSAQQHKKKASSRRASGWATSCSTRGRSPNSIGSPSRTARHRFRHGRHPAARRWRGRRLGTRRRPSRVCLLAGLHRHQGIALETNAAKICKVMDLAVTATGAPIIGSQRVRVARAFRRGSHRWARYADIFLRNTLASGVVPQISAVLGPVRWRRSLFAGAHRFCLLYGARRAGFVFYVTRSRRGEDPITHREGARMTTSVAPMFTRRRLVSPTSMHASEPECLDLHPALLSFLPSNNVDDGPAGAATDPADSARGTAARPDARRAVEALRHARSDRPRGLTTAAFSEMMPAFAG